MCQFHWFLDQSDHKHLYHPPVHPAHPVFVNPERSGQKKSAEKSAENAKNAKTLTPGPLES